MSEVVMKGLKKVYDNKVTAVHDVNLEIKDKEQEHHAQDGGRP